MSKENRVAVETQRWLAYARRDLRAAQVLAGEAGDFAQQICFLSQQAAEKGLKAVLIFLQIDFPPRHDLELLRVLVPEGFYCRQLTNLEWLTEWAIESRYPTDLADPSEQDARIALQQAEAILAMVEQDLTQHGFSL
ncbi:HEPN domain-containing protein [Trichothermofontia sp.]